MIAPSLVGVWNSHLTLQTTWEKDVTSWCSCLIQQFPFLGKSEGRMSVLNTPFLLYYSRLFLQIMNYGIDMYCLNARYRVFSVYTPPKRRNQAALFQNLIHMYPYLFLVCFSILFSLHLFLVQFLGFTWDNFPYVFSFKSTLHRKEGTKPLHFTLFWVV